VRICAPARARLGGYVGGPGSACTSGMDAAIRRHGLCAASCAASQLPEVRDGCAELPLLLSQMPEVVVPFAECLHSVRRWVVSDGRGRPALRRQRTSRKQTTRRKQANAAPAPSTAGPPPGFNTSAEFRCCILPTYPCPQPRHRDSMDCTSSKATASARDCAASSSKPTVEYASARLLSTYGNYGKPGSGVCRAQSQQPSHEDTTRHAWIP
jgi:hypothetical protein